MRTVPSATGKLAGRAVATEELEDALGRILGATPETVEISERRPLSYCSTFPLEELRVRWGNNSDERLVWKDLSHEGPADPVWAVKAAFLRDPLREITVYRDLLAPAGLSTPRYRGALSQAERGRHWLFLDHVDGDPLWQCGEDEVWQGAARWLAQLHARFAGRVERLPRRLLRHDSAYYRRWLERARRFVRWPQESDDCSRDFAWLAARATKVVDWLIEQPATLLHGEFYPANVLVEPRCDGTRIRPLDWEMAGIGSGLLDLAALVSGVWSEADREMLVSAYRSELPVELRPSEGELRGGLARCRLLLAVQWLGWSEHWTPPQEHAHDWLGTALELAAEVQP